MRMTNSSPNGNEGGTGTFTDGAGRESVALAATLRSEGMETLERTMTAPVTWRARLRFRLQKKLTEAQTTRIYGAAATDALQAAYFLAFDDHRFSATEEARITAMAAALGVRVSLDETLQGLVNHYRLLAQIEEGHLPVVKTPLLLQKDEECHLWIGVAEHKEMRSVTRRVNYSGPVVSVPIMKGLRWRIGSISVQRVQETALTYLDSVGVYFTNKRIHLQGSHKSASMPLSKLTGYTVYKDGMQIKKATGRDVFLVNANEDWEVAGAVLAALTADR
jgi:hypothetical protein